MSTKLGVIGLGKWGSALAFAASQMGGTKVWSRTPRSVPNFCSLDEVLDCSHIIISISAQSLVEFLSQSFVFRGQNILVASKGIESKNGRFLNEIYEDFVPRGNLAFLSGPSFAVEVQASLPTALVVSSYSKECAESFLSFFPSFIKLYTSSDVTGAEVAGAYKNVIAIAAGVCDGLGLGNNARAALITRGLAEMTRFGIAFGAKVETFLGLSGVGDLFLTATSEKSRNYRVGLLLASGKNIDEILSILGETAEGVETARAVLKLAAKKELYSPIAEEVVSLLDGQNAAKSIQRLLLSSKREEF
jgi:glycerol-3-phosphate dehydrogenase (NAD(P)+)